MFVERSFVYNSRELNYTIKNVIRKYTLVGGALCLYMKNLKKKKKHDKIARSPLAIRAPN